MPALTGYTDFLTNFETHGQKFTGMRELSLLAKMLAFNLTGFTRRAKLMADGSTEKATSTSPVTNSWCWKLMHLRPKPELFKVVTLQVINAITHDMYLSPRDVRKLNVFDEVWQFMREGVRLKESIEAAYRMSRKHNASIAIVTQSILDLKTVWLRGRRDPGQLRLQDLPGSARLSERAPGGADRL